MIEVIRLLLMDFVNSKFLHLLFTTDWVNSTGKTKGELCCQVGNAVS